MIDTIVFRVYGVKKKYERILSYIYEISDKNFIISNNSNIREYNRGIAFHRSAVHFAKIKSYNTKLNFRYDESQDYLEFNFSVPKYIYGNNFKELITAEDEEINLQYSYIVLKKTMIEIFSHIDVFFDEKDIQIRRVDFCYNHYFRSKRSALLYLDRLKVMKFKRSKPQCYKTSIFIRKDTYSFKIYHKLTEYLKHEKKARVNENLKSFGNILRFEISFKNRFMSYLYNVKYDTKHEVFFRFKDKRNYSKYKNYVRKFWLKNVQDESFLQYANFDFKFYKMLYYFFKEKVLETQISIVNSDLNGKVISHCKMMNKITHLTDKKKTKASSIIKNLTLLKKFGAEYLIDNKLLSYSTIRRLQIFLKEFDINIENAEHIENFKFSFSKNFENQKFLL